jgi:DNA-binding protein HU-beta
MNKADLIEQLCKDANLTKNDASTAIDSITGTIVNALKKGDKVTLVGFGTFSVSQRKARNGRNPQTGETIKIKASKTARFKGGKEFAEILNGTKKKK